MVRAGAILLPLGFVILKRGLLPRGYGRIAIGFGAASQALTSDGARSSRSAPPDAQRLERLSVTAWLAVADGPPGRDTVIWT
jgi:hypothetical protein